MSRYPDRGFEYKGVLISNSDLGYKGNKKPKMPAGTIHGSVECIDGQYYVFYHRCTNDTDYSRQACAEKITMNADGTFNMAEVTTQGVGQPLISQGQYPAALCCNLYNKDKNYKKGRRAIITANGGENYITRISDGTVIGFIYFNFSNPSKITITVRGGGGTMSVRTAERGGEIAHISVSESKKWTAFTAGLAPTQGVHPLYFIWHGKEIEFLALSFE